MVALCSALVSRAEGVLYFKGTVYQALGEAQRQKKMLMVEFFASWNYKSRWMSENIIAKSDVHPIIDKGFVLVKVDTKTKEGADLAVQYQVTDYPSIVIFNKGGTVVDKIDKTLDKTDFLTRIAQVQLENDGKSIWELRKIFISAQNGDRVETDRLAKAYLAATDKQSVVALVHKELFVNSEITFYGSSAFEYLLKNRADFDAVFTKIMVDELVNKIYVDAIFPYAIGAYEYDSVFVARFAAQSELNVVAQRLAVMAQLRHGKDIDGYIEQVNYLVDNVSEDLVARLILSFDYVAQHGTVAQKRNARHTVEKFGRSTTSPSELTLIDSLTKKLSE